MVFVNIDIQHWISIAKTGETAHFILMGDRGEKCIQVGGGL